MTQVEFFIRACDLLDAAMMYDQSAFFVRPSVLAAAAILIVYGPRLFMTLMSCFDITEQELIFPFRLLMHFQLRASTELFITKNINEYASRLLNQNSSISLTHIGLRQQHAENKSVTDCISEFVLQQQFAKLSLLSVSSIIIGYNSPGLALTS